VAPAQPSEQPQRTILVVEDEKNVRDLLQMYLGKEGFQVRLAADGAEALRLFSLERPALVILDLMLPKLDGWEVCRQIRRTSATPILMLTARAEEVDRVVGLELGADDYVVKPFAPRELVARVRAILRRAAAPSWEKQEVVEAGGLRLDVPRHEVTVRGEAVHLTPTEFRLLHYLAANVGRVCTRGELLERVWGYDSESDARTVDVHIKRLRRKAVGPVAAPGLKGAGFSIATVWGLGYKLEVG
jgi:two-component system response regulator ResD